MEELKRYAYILKFLEKVKNPVGKTFIQKGLYLIQEGLGEKIGYKFRLHFYGPYSSELSSDLSVLESWKMIRVEYNPSGYGYNVSITEEGRGFLNSLEEKGVETDIGEKNISKVLDLIGGKVVREMELLGTTLYFAKVADDETEIPDLVKMVKPKFNTREIKAAIKKIKEKGFLPEIPSFSLQHQAA